MNSDREFTNFDKFTSSSPRRSKKFTGFRCATLCRDICISLENSRFRLADVNEAAYLHLTITASTGEILKRLIATDDVSDWYFVVTPPKRLLFAYLNVSSQGKKGKNRKKKS